MALELSWAHMSPSTLQYDLSVKPIQAKNLLRLILKYYTSRTVKDRCSLRFWARVQLPGLCHLPPHTPCNLEFIRHHLQISTLSFFLSHLNPPKTTCVFLHWLRSLWFLGVFFCCCSVLSIKRTDKGKLHHELFSGLKAIMHCEDFTQFETTVNTQSVCYHYYHW